VRISKRPALREGLPPAVVLLTVDTLRPDFIRGVSDAAAPTPAIDALLADSVVFENARSAAPWTKPSLATILTGVSPWVHRTTNRRARLPAGLTTLAETLHAAGYRTAGVGLNVHLERMFRFGQGFQDYAFPARAEVGIGIGALVLTRLAPERFPELFPSTTAIADVALAWLERHGDEPFFLWVHVLDPHWPYAPPDAYVPPRHAHSTIGRAWGDPTTVTNVQAGNVKLGEDDRARVRELYRAEIDYVDDNLARIVLELKRIGRYDDALIVFASDHGEEFWEHGRFEHGHTLFDEVLRVPLAFKLPGAARRGPVDAPVSTESVTPTIVDALGLDVDPDRYTAPSLAGFWRTPDGPPDPGPLFSGGTYYHGEKDAVVFDGLKYVQELDTGATALYDLAADPGETRSVALLRPADVERAKALLRERLERCHALRAELGLEDEDGAELDPSDEARLKALGYAGGGG